MRGEKGADRQTLARTVCLDADAGERIDASSQDCLVSVVKFRTGGGVARCLSAMADEHESTIIIGKVY